MPSATRQAVDVLRSASEKARDLRSRIIGQEHVLLALGAYPNSLAAQLLADVGAAAFPMALAAWINPGASTDADPKPTVRLAKAVREADAEAVEHGRPATSADLVLGILRSEIGVGYRMLTSAGVSLDGARAAVERVTMPHDELDHVVESALIDVLNSARRG